MVAVTIRMKYLKAATAFLLMAILVSLAVLAVLSAGAKDEHRGSQIVTAEERVAYLNRCGWIVSDSPDREREVQIPSEFNAVYEDYNRLQRKQGFNLEKYKGAVVEEYTYTVKNHPYASENVVAHLLVADGKIVGGDISSLEIGGFMQGLIEDK